MNPRRTIGTRLTFLLVCLGVTVILLPACRGVGDSCQQAECPDGLVCLDYKAPYTCQPPQAKGQRCGGDDDVCQDGLVCGCSYSNFVRDGGCVETVCKARVEAGEACISNKDCRSPFVCQFAREPSVCGEKLPRGSECGAAFVGSDQQCTAGLQCNLATNPPSCQPSGIVGSPCSSDDHCNGELFCDQTYQYPRCTQIADAGEACRGDVSCKEGLVCRPTHADCNTCVPLREFGETCAENEDCAGELICLATTSPGTCAQRVPEGGRCSDTDECGGDGSLLCNLGLETPVCERGFSSEAGEPCSSDYLCLTDLICNEGFEPAACAEYGEVGDVCGDHHDCAPDLACNASTSPSECASPDQVGTLCNRDSACPEGTICHRGRAEAWMCREPSVSAESCGRDNDCTDELICLEGQCTEPTLEGQECTHPFECERVESECRASDAPDCVAAYMVCNQADMVCTMQRDAGGRCAAGSDCRTGLICNTTAEPPECQTPGTEGDSCSSDEHCASDFKCSEGVCRAIVCP